MNQEASTAPPLLSVRGLSVGIGRPRIGAVDNISFNIRPGEIIGLAGESGSGKSVTALSLCRLLPAKADPQYSGDVCLSGIPGNLLKCSGKALRKIRGSRVCYIFQEPSASFNPLFTIGDHLREILKLQGIPREQRPARMRNALEEVGIEPNPINLGAYPGEFSGGMLQRAAIACALIGSPQLLVADEATTALDTSTQKRVVDLLARINHERGMAILFISHDLALLKQIASRVLVMHRGRIVEEGPAGEILLRPEHPYTRSLVSAIPKLRLG